MKKLVFIIDDDPVYLNFMKGHFKQMSTFETRVFQSGPEGIAALEEVKPYLIILDHLFTNAPDKTGLDYLKEIRKKHSGVPVIYITALNDESLRAKTKKLKVADHILKNDAFLIHLRTAMDKLDAPPKGILSKIFKK
ncbi:MAG: response regulator [Cyclobacteriaceae bacterium]|nr:MAG: response regulator [Cyclobacteriaceae bacterium]